MGNKEDVMSFIDIRGGSSGGGGASASAGGDGKTAEKSSYILKLLRNDKLVKNNYTPPKPHLLSYHLSPLSRFTAQVGTMAEISFFRPLEMARLIF